MLLHDIVIILCIQYDLHNIVILMTGQGAQRQPGEAEALRRGRGPVGGVYIYKYKMYIYIYNVYIYICI